MAIAEEEILIIINSLALSGKRGNNIKKGAFIAPFFYLYIAMKKRIILLATYLLSLQYIFGGCGNVFLPELQQGVSTQDIRDRFQYITTLANRNSSILSSDTIRIPVVFNILYRNAVSDSLLFDKSRYYAVLDTANKYLNIDINYLYAINHPTFHDIIAVPYIQLIPARLDPQGRPTDGFRYKQWTPVSGNDICGLLYFNAQQKIKLDQYGGITAWDNRNYLNYWVGDYHTPVQCFSGQSTYPIFPFLSGHPLNFMDGIILQDYVFKSNNFWKNYAYSTIMHELGHYLGLLHIWGGLFDDSEKGCNIDDNIRDTPTQYQAIYHCNDSVNSCNDGANDKIDMCSNVMDYADGITYTQQQVNVMHNTLLNARKMLPIPKLYAQLQQNIFSICAGDSITLQWNDLSSVRSDFVIPSWDTSTLQLIKTVIAPQRDTQFAVYLTNGYDTIFESVNISILTPQATYTFPNTIFPGDSLHINLQHVTSVSAPVSYHFENGIFSFSASSATDSFLLHFENNCGQDSIFITYQLEQATPTVYNNVQHLAVIPNPAFEKITIMGLAGLNKTIVYAIDGRKVLQNDAETTIDISMLEEGTYLIIAFDNKNMYTAKFIKRK